MISARKDNEYHHPQKTAVNRLKAIEDLSWVRAPLQARALFELTGQVDEFASSPIGPVNPQNRESIEFPAVTFGLGIDEPRPFRVGIRLGSGVAVTARVIDAEGVKRLQEALSRSLGPGPDEESWLRLDYVWGGAEVPSEVLAAAESEDEPGAGRDLS